MKYNITILLSTIKNRFEEEKCTKTRYCYRRKVANQWNGWHFKADMTYVAYKQTKYTDVSEDKNCSMKRKIFNIVETLSKVSHNEYFKTFST